MKLLLILGLVCAAHAAPDPGYPTVPTSEFDCSQVADPTIDHFYPHVVDCNSFYRCVPGHTLAYFYTCNDLNEVFDESYQMCVNVWDAYPPCGHKQTTTAWTGSTETAAPVTEDPNPFYCDNFVDGIYPNPVQCESFFKCNDDVLNGVPAIPVYCPPGLVFNAEYSYCDWPYNVPPPCGTKVSKVPLTQGAACEDDERYECNGATSIVVDEDCVTFYNCDASIQRVCPSKCISGLVFNSAVGYCDYMHNTAPPCGTKVTKQPRDQGAACPDNERYECNGATSIVVEADCETFYNCDVNIQRVCPSKCVPGLLFNEATGVCDWPENVSQPCGTM